MFDRIQQVLLVFVLSNNTFNVVIEEDEVEVERKKQGKEETKVSRRQLARA